MNEKRSAIRGQKSEIRCQKVRVQHQEVTTMFANHINGFRSGLVIGCVAALLIVIPAALYAQAPLTIQPSPTNRVGVNTTSPQSDLDVNGAVHVTGTVNVGSTVTATGFVGDGSQLTNLPASGGSSGFDPELKLRFYEDFIAAPATGFAPGIDDPTVTIRFRYNWVFSYNSSVNVTTTGTTLITGDAFLGTDLDVYGYNYVITPVIATKNPTLKVRWAQNGTQNGTRSIGLNDGSGYQPRYGIYFRNTLNGNIVAVCRNNNTESVLDTGVGAATGTFHTGRIIVTGTSSAEIFIDGVSKGTISSNIPTVNLTAFMAASGGRVETDYIFVEQDR